MSQLGGRFQAPRFQAQSDAMHSKHKSDYHDAQSFIRWTKSQVPYPGARGIQVHLVGRVWMEPQHLRTALGRARAAPPHTVLRRVTGEQICHYMSARRW